MRRTTPEDEEHLLISRVSIDEEVTEKKTKLFLGYPVRYSISGLIFIAMFTLYSQRTNLSIAIIKISAEQNWDNSLQGFVLSSFFWGYITTQLVGGVLSSTFGAKPVLLVSVLGSSFFNAILPFLADRVELFITVRLLSGILSPCVLTLTGILQGPLYPTAHNALTAWFPPEERSTFLGFSYSGSYLGMVLTMLLSPVIIENISWQFSFFILSSIGFLWVALWVLFGASNPEEHPFISYEEMDFILQSRMKQFDSIDSSATSTDKRNPTAPLKFSEVPWKEILSTAAVWAIIINNFTVNWGFYIIFTWLPNYFDHELHFNMKKMTYLAPLPYLAAFINILISGRIADWCRKKYDVATVRKVFQVLAQTVSSIGMLLLCFNPSKTMAVVYMVTKCLLVFTLQIICVGGVAFTVGGISSNHMDIGPRYAGILFGLSNTAGTIPGIVGVALTGIILDVTHSWFLVFVITIGVYTFGSVVFVMFAKGHVILK